MKHTYTKYFGDAQSLTIVINTDDPITTCEIYRVATLLSHGFSVKRCCDPYVELIGAKKALKSALNRVNSLTDKPFFTKEAKKDIWKMFFDMAAPKLDTNPPKKDEDRLLDNKINEVILHDFRQRLVKEIDKMYSLEA